MNTLIVFTLVVVGAMVGIELAVAAIVNPIADRMSARVGLAMRSDAARLLGRIMPFWYIASVLLVASWTTWVWGQPAAPAVAVAGVLLVISVLMSIVLLVPINSRVAQWSAGTAPADWHDQIKRWDRLHYTRTVIIITAFAVLAAAGVS